MEFLNVKDYDENRMRCLCVSHNEDTPSLVYNPKAYEMHCFGCGVHIDFIDAYMKGKNATFIEAVQKLFEVAGIQYSFGEQGVRTQHQYRYPKPEQSEEKDKVYSYLSLRKISKETADYLDIRQDSKGNLVFNYYDSNDVLTMVKYRPSRKVNKGESKCWVQEGSDSTHLLYNMNRINTTQPLVIACGELDCAALIECGIQNAVSVPLGETSYKWIETNWEFLEQFNSIYLAHDNDDVGNKFVKEVIPRLGSWRCKIIDCPEVYENENGSKYKVKDINEVLVRFGKEKIVEIVSHAKDTPVPSLVDFTTIKDIDLSEMDGIQTGFADLDKELMRLFYGNLHIVSGRPGSGKTSFLYQIVANAVDGGVCAWVFSRELPGFQSRSWLDYLLAGPRNLNEYTSKSGSQYWRVTARAKEEIDKFYKEKLYLYRDEWSNDVEEIKTSMVDAARKYGCRLFLVDNLMTVDLHGTSDSELQKQTEFINWLIQFSVKYQVCTILVAHPRKTMPGQTNELDMYDIAGSSNLVNLAHRAFGLKRISDSEKAGVRNKRDDGWEKEPFPFDVRLSVLKDRMRGRSNFSMGFYYDEKSRRFFTNAEEYDHQYSWDQTIYADALPYPVDDKQEEILGKIGER